MDQVKIGKFIAERRKKVNLTQMELAEKLLITDKAVSKWERGIAMPDSSIMLELCNILGITVNELLTGEELNVENYNKELERNLLSMVKQKEESDRKLLALEWVIAILSCILLLIPITIVALIPMEEWKGALVVLSGFIPAVVGLFIAVKIEQSAGYYECQHCKHKYVPSYIPVLFAMHMGRTRYLKCPNCNKKSWQKKVISKE